MNLNNDSKAIEKILGDSFNAQISIYRIHTLPNSIDVAIIYRVEQADLSRTQDFLDCIVNQFNQGKIVSSHKEKLKEMGEQFDIRLKELEAKITELERYKTYYDLHKEMIGGSK